MTHGRDSKFVANPVAGITVDNVGDKILKGYYVFSSVTKFRVTTLIYQSLCMYIIREGTEMTNENQKREWINIAASFSMPLPNQRRGVPQVPRSSTPLPPIIDRVVNRKMLDFSISILAVVDGQFSFISRENFKRQQPVVCVMLICPFAFL